MTKFEKDLLQSRKIEALFRKHPKFPFINLFPTKNTDEHVLNKLFWLYMVKPYVKAYGNEKWKNWMENFQYESFRQPDDTSTSSGSALDFYGEQTRHLLQISPIGAMEDLHSKYHFSVNAGTDSWLSEVLEKPDFILYFLGMSVDLRHPEALDKAREFLHAFFIETLPLEEMTKKIEWFDEHEAHKFKRGSSYANKAIQDVKTQGHTAQLVATASKTAKVGDPCPISGMWFCQGVSTEQGIYLRKGDPMPGQSYNEQERAAMVWKLIKEM